jgi:SAM-dependent methyltransferase
MKKEEYRAMFELEDRLWWYRGMRHITAAILGRLLEGRKAPKILDVGCGTGYSIGWLRTLYGAGGVYGIDLSPEAAAFWKERAVITAAVSSAHKLPFADNQFDLVTCFDVIYQLSGDLAEQSILEMQRVLKPGGLLFIREPAYEWMRGSHDVAVGTAHRFTLREIGRLVTGPGYVQKRATYANGLLLWAAIPRRLFSRLGGGDSSDVRPVPGWINSVLESALRLEAILLRRFALPFGLSAIVVVGKDS